MDVTKFENSPVGRLVPITGRDAYLDRDFAHFAFVPTPLPESLPLREATYKLISEADRDIGRLDAAVGQLPRPALLVRPALRREAVSTSALEGTYAPFEEVLQAEYLEDSRQRAEVREVRNYVHAAEVALQRTETMPICVRLIAELQAVLVRGTRGDAYDAGRLRERQVYIGERLDGIERSRFVPPPPGPELINGMSAWEKWINTELAVPLLAKIAMAHYQFETLHPFSDGNGRLGRLVITLQLMEAGAIAYPILNLSPWLEPRKDEYKNLLLALSSTGDPDPWIAFFCQGVAAQARDSRRRIEALVAFRDDLIARLRSENAKGVVLQLAETLIGYPLITPSEVANLFGVTYPPANAAVARLERMGVLTETTGRSYGRVYACPEVLRIVGGP